MKKIIFSLTIFALLTVNHLHAGGLDFHFGLGGGADISKNKTSFSSPESKMENAFVGTPDIFAGLGYKFLNLMFLDLSIGLEYQFQLPYAIGMAERSLPSLSSVQANTLGWMIDHYLNSYLTARFTIISPAFPIGITGIAGVGFRDAKDLYSIHEVGGQKQKLRIAPAKKGVEIGLNLGARVFVGPMFVGMNYNLFPNSWAGSDNKYTVNSIVITGGFGWLF